MIELRGAPVAQAIYTEVSEVIARLQLTPRLVSIVDATAEDARSYSRQLRRASERLSIEFIEYEIDDQTPAVIDQLNSDPACTSIFLHEPAPQALRDRIDPMKDPEQPVPSTAEAVMAILDHYEIGLDRVEVVVVGRSATVGRPVAGLLLDRRPGPTVTVCHSGTRDLTAHTRRADVVVAAAGVPRLIVEVGRDAVVVDVGTNFVDGKLIGDVDHASMRCRALTPVPGGVGPVTVACLMRSVVRLAEGGHEKHTG